MTKTGKKTFIFFILILLAAAGYFLWQERAVFWSEIKEGQVPAESDVKEKKMSSPEKVDDANRLSFSTLEIIERVESKIDEISPVKPVLGGEWSVTRFWFVTDYDFYVEYEDGHILRQVLVCARGIESAPQFNVVAYFEPGENEWLLKKGEDLFYGQKTTLYERGNTGKWVIRN